MNEVVKKQDVINLIENYYSAPESSRKTLLDNIILAVKCLSSQKKQHI